MARLGGRVLGFSGTEGTSVQKGETLADTIRMVEAYSDVIVLRHPQEGAARLAAEFTDKPVINAGDGAGQHPTQTLLDLYTIWDEKGSFQGQNVTLVGDLRYGRTVHSLTYALAELGAHLTFVSPPTLEMPREILEHVKERGLTFRVTNRLEDVVREADVLYVTRIQRERFPDPQEYEAVAGSYRIDEAVLRDADGHGHDARPEPRHGMEGHREGRGSGARYAGDRQDRFDRTDGHRERDSQLQRRGEAPCHAAGPRHRDPALREPELHLEPEGTDRIGVRRPLEEPASRRVQILRSRTRRDCTAHSLSPPSATESSMPPIGSGTRRSKESRK